MHAFHLFVAALLAAVSSLSMTQSVQSPERGPAPGNPQIEAARVRYGAASWPKGERRGGLALGDLSFHGIAGRAVEATTRDATERFFDREASSPDAERSPLFRIESWTLATADQAHERLVGLLAYVSSPKKMPTTAESGIAAGDVGYVGLAGSGAGISWIAFARGNVLVRIGALSTSPDAPALGPIASAADAEILKSPRLGADAELPRPMIASLSLAESKVTAGAVVPVALTVSDPSGGEPLVAWIVGGKGQGFVERDASGAWQLHTTGPGTIALTAAVRGKLGSLASSSTTVEVLPR